MEMFFKNFDCTKPQTTSYEDSKRINSCYISSDKNRNQITHSGHGNSPFVIPLTGHPTNLTLVNLGTVKGYDS